MVYSEANIERVDAQTVRMEITVPSSEVDEAIEKAAGLAAEAEDEAEEADASIDQWRKIYEQNQAESMSKFEQAAGEIAEKASVKFE